MDPLDKRIPGASLMRSEICDTTQTGPLVNAINDFHVSVAFARSTAVLSVRGEVDCATAPHLSTILTAVMSRRNVSVVLDLAQVQLLAAAGLGVIAAANRQLLGEGRTLTITSPSPPAAHALRLCAMHDLIVDGLNPPLLPEPFTTAAGAAVDSRRGAAANSLSAASRRQGATMTS